MSAVGRWGRSRDGRHKLRYAAASVTSAAVGQAALMVAFGAFRWSARSASLFAFTIGAVSSYHLNRVWVWGRGGRSDLLREIVPFWTVAAAGLALSTATIVVAEDRAALVTESHAIRTAVVMAAALLSAVLVWLLKFLILDRYVFARSPHVPDGYVAEHDGPEAGPSTIAGRARSGGADD